MRIFFFCDHYRLQLLWYAERFIFNDSFLSYRLCVIESCSVAPGRPSLAQCLDLASLPVSEVICRWHRVVPGVSMGCVLLRFQRSMLDLSLQWRFARLPNNAKLEMVPVSGRAGTGSTVRSFRSVTRFVPCSALLGMIWSGRRSRGGSGVAYMSHTGWLRCGAECTVRAVA